LSDTLVSRTHDITDSIIMLIEEQRAVGVS
jgi:hypothetical protein